MAFTLRLAGSDASPGAAEFEVGDLFVLTLHVRDSDTATVTSVTDDQSQGTWQRAVRHAAGGQFVEIWWVVATVDANTVVTVTYSAAVAASNIVHAFVPPASFEVGETNGTNTSGTTTHSCGSVTAPADALVVTASSISNAFSPTANADYTLLFQGSRAFDQYRLTSGSVTSTGAWTSAANETVTSCQAVFRPPAGGGGFIPYPFPRGLGGGFGSLSGGMQ